MQQQTQETRPTEGFKPHQSTADSPKYRKQIKRVVAMIKNLRGVARLPSGSTPRPKESDKDEVWQEWSRANSLRPNRETAHFFMIPLGRF